MDMILIAFGSFIVGGLFGVAVMAVVACKVLNGNEDKDEL